MASRHPCYHSGSLRGSLPPISTASRTVCRWCASHLFSGGFATSSIPLVADLVDGDSARTRFPIEMLWIPILSHRPFQVGERRSAGLSMQLWPDRLLPDGGRISSSEDADAAQCHRSWRPWICPFSVESAAFNLMAASLLSHKSSSQEGRGIQNESFLTLLMPRYAKT